MAIRRGCQPFFTVFAQNRRSKIVIPPHREGKLRCRAGKIRADCLRRGLLACVRRQCAGQNRKLLCGRGVNLTALCAQPSLSGAMFYCASAPLGGCFSAPSVSAAAQRRKTVLFKYHFLLPHNKNELFECPPLSLPFRDEKMRPRCAASLSDCPARRNAPAAALPRGSLRSRGRRPRSVGLGAAPALFFQHCADSFPAGLKNSCPRAPQRAGGRKAPERVRPRRGLVEMRPAAASGFRRPRGVNPAGFQYLASGFRRPRSVKPAGSQYSASGFRRPRGVGHTRSPELCIHFPPPSRCEACRVPVLRVRLPPPSRCEARRIPESGSPLSSALRCGTAAAVRMVPLHWEEGRQPSARPFPPGPRPLEAPAPTRHPFLQPCPGRGNGNTVSLSSSGSRRRCRARRGGTAENARDAAIFIRRRRARTVHLLRAIRALFQKNGQSVPRPCKAALSAQGQAPRMGHRMTRAHALTSI